MERIAQAMNCTVAQLTGTHRGPGGRDTQNVVLMSSQSMTPAFEPVTGEEPTQRLLCLTTLQRATWDDGNEQPSYCGFMLDGCGTTILYDHMDIDNLKTIAWMNENGELADGPESITSIEGLSCPVVDLTGEDLTEMDFFQYMGEM